MNVFESIYKFRVTYYTDDDIIQEVQLQWASSDPVKFSDYFPHLLLLSLEEFEYKNGVSKISTG